MISIRLLRSIKLIYELKASIATVRSEIESKTVQLNSVITGYVWGRSLPDIIIIGVRLSREHICQFINCCFQDTVLPVFDETLLAFHIRKVDAHIAKVNEWTIQVLKAELLHYILVFPVQIC